MANTLAIIGAQWGDEGKGKMTDLLSQEADMVIRFQGGNNAGHTIKFDGKTYALHLVPSGVFNEAASNLLAAGMVIDPKALYEEIKMLNELHITTKNRLFVDKRAHVILPVHKRLDALDEANRSEKIGTTHKGIGPAYKDKAARTGLKMESFVSQASFDLYLDTYLPSLNQTLKSFGQKPLLKADIKKEMAPYQAFLKPLIVDGAALVNRAIEREKNVLFEGAQGTMLCLDHGTYPFVTSSSPSAASIPLNVGIAPKHVKKVLGIVKAYTTRVGSGAFPSEIDDDIAKKIRLKGNEFGTTTGRPRRIGHLDIVQLKHAIRLNGFDAFALMLFDVLSGLDSLKLCTAYKLEGKTIDTVPSDHETLKKVTPVYESMPGFKDDLNAVKRYEDLSKEAKNYIERIEVLTGVSIAYISTGPDRKALIKREEIIKKTLKE